MNYPSPNATDFLEIRTLNAAFLALLRSDARRIGLASALSVDQRAALTDLSDGRAKRLAESPFLLFSLRESDDEFWDSLHQGGKTRSLFDGAADDDPDSARLVSAALGFIWQMARQNPYVLRLTCCASLHWAERIAEQPLVTLIHRAANAGDLLGLRAGDNPHVWRRLLAAASERDAAVRTALLNTVLQTLLVSPAGGNREAFRSAACRVDVPAATIAATTAADD